MNVLDLAARHRTWLAERQSVVAENIANSNTPGYAAKTTPDFAQTLAATSQVRPVRTDPRHIEVAASGVTTTDDESGDAQTATHSGNTVDMEHELLAAGEVKASFALNVSVVKSFTRMLQMSVRS
jgi:flagellar basal-body rod protein FlgB